MGWYVKNPNEPLIEGVEATETTEYNDTLNNKEFKKSWKREEKELWKNKRMYGQFVREMPETTYEKETWYWPIKPCCLLRKNKQFEQIM